jgi:hypothetical protein
LRAGAVVLLAALTATALFEAEIGRELLLSSAMVAGAPPVLYLLLAFALLRGAPFSRRLGWAVAACGIYAALGIVSGVTLSFAHPMSLEGALRRSLWSYAPAPFLHLLAAPLVLLAWRSRLASARVVVRAERAAPPLVARVPAPPLPSATPDWDSALQASPPQWASAQGTALFERAGRQREVASELVAEPRKPTPPAVVTAPAAAMGAPPSPMVPVPAPVVTAAGPMVAGPTPVAAQPTPRTLPPSPTVPPPAPRVAAGSPRVAAPPPAEAPTATTKEEPVVRVPFDRIADQLPPDVFTLPPARLGDSLHEPHVLLVPRRLVLPQLGEGAVEIPWTLVDSQFPELAFAMPQAEVRRRFPGWVLSLPMDEVVRQIPLDTFRVPGPAADLTDISEFPAPFTPGAPQPEETAAPEPPAPGAPAAKAGPALIATSAAPAPVAAVETVPSIPEVLFVPEATPAPIVAAVPSAPPVPVAQGIAAAQPLPVAPPARVASPPAPVVPPPARVAPPPAPVVPPPARVAPSPAPVVPLPAAVAPPLPPVAASPPSAPEIDPRPAAPAPAVTDEASEALGRALAPWLAPLGAFDWQARRVGARPLVCFVPPALARGAIDALAASATPVVEQLASWGIEQVTIRTARLACVLTPLGTRGCLAATVRRGGGVAMLELLSARAARATREGARAASPAIAFPSVATTPVVSGNGHGDVGEAARALAAFGALASSVAEAEGAAPSVYVFAGRDQAVLAGAARAVHDGLIARHDQEALGRLESVVLRRGRERAILRPFRGHAGAPAVLAAAGEVAMPGRAHRAAAQAATLLEAR